MGWLHPPIIFSYRTDVNSGDKIGEQCVLALARALLEKYGIQSFNGKQVLPGQDWRIEWMPG